MIEPSMATMLAVITTDAPLDAPALKMMLRRAVNVTFNRISVDACGSTNDTVIVLANGQAAEPPSFASLRTGLPAVCADLARAIVATRLAEITEDERTTGLIITSSRSWDGAKKTWDEAFGAYKPVNMGIGGDQTGHVLWRITEGKELEPVKAKLAKASNNETPFIYAEAGLWYDALKSISDLIDAAPQNLELRKQRTALLTQVGLPSTDE